MSRQEPNVLREDRRELNFAAFDTACLKPMYSLLDASVHMGASRSRARLFAQSSLLEGLCWTALGALLGHFPPRTPRQVAATAFQQIHDLDEFLRAWSYLFDERWLQYLRSPGSEVNPPPVPAATQQDQELAITAFETCLTCGINLIRSPIANATVALLDFDRSDDIELYLEKRVNLEEISEALALDVGINRESGDITMGALYGGFGYLIEFLDTFRGLGLRYNGLDTDKRGLASALIQNIAQLLRWRFFFFERQSIVVPGFQTRQ